MECIVCERILNDFYFELAWVNHIDQSEVYIERYCGHQCMVKVFR